MEALNQPIGKPMLLAAVKFHLQKRKSAAISAWLKEYAPFTLSVWASLTERLSEWSLALITIGWGWMLLQPGATFRNKTFSIMENWMSEEGWTLIFLLGGSARLALLIINGHWRKSPHLRMIAAASTFWIWTFMAIGFAAAGTNSPGAITYTIFAFCELINVFRASRDAGFNDEKAAITKGLA